MVKNIIDCSLCLLDNDTLSIKTYYKIDTSQLDVEPLWDFVGLEDARLVKWDDKILSIEWPTKTLSGDVILSEKDKNGASISNLDFKILRI